jgi:hypothetical protein
MQVVGYSQNRFKKIHMQALHPHPSEVYFTLQH